MARPLRIEFSGATYHVMARGNEKREIVRNDADRRAFLISLGRMSERFPVEVNVFALLENHYHLLLKTVEPCIAACMQWFNSDYTIKFNKRHRRVGHLLQGRYKSIIVGTDEYFLKAADYIHLNPLRAGLEERIGEYGWSSYADYSRKKAVHELVNRERLLSLLALESRNPFAAFKARLGRRAKEEGEEEYLGELKKGFILGGDDFVEQMRRLVPPEPLPDVPQHGWLLGRKNPAKALEAVLGSLELKMDDFFGPRKGRANPERDRAISILYSRSGLTESRIGELFGVSTTAVSKAIARVEASAKMDTAIRAAVGGAGSARRGAGKKEKS